MNNRNGIFEGKWSFTSRICIGTTSIIKVIFFGEAKEGRYTAFNSWKDLYELDSLVQTVKIFSQDGGMEFGTKKFAGETENNGENYLW